MTQGERVKAVRKKFNLTMEQFGERIGNVSKSTISNIENGNRNLTHLMLKSICSEFNIHEEWLLYGEGPMEQSLDRQEEIARLTADLFRGESGSFKERLILALARLDEKDWEVLEKIAEELAKEKD